jgi:hypothetical protein
MDRQLKQSDEYDHRLESKLEDESGLDAAGYWFTAAVLFAVLAAGVIVYRTDSYNVRTASNDLATVAQSTLTVPVPKCGAATGSSAICR